MFPSEKIVTLRFLPGKRDESVHMAVFPTAAELRAYEASEIVERWDRLIAVREAVLAEIEPLRKNKQIGSSLQAKVVLSATASELALLERHARDLPMLFIVSDVELRPSTRDDESARSGQGPQIEIERASGVKCERCWRYVQSVSVDPAWAGLCERCQDALAETVNG